MPVPNEVDPSTLSGAQRAAIFLLSLSEEAAASVFQHFEPDEIRRIMLAMKELRNVPNQSLQNVIDDFTYMVENKPVMLEGGADYLRSALDRALGRDRARLVLGETEEELPPTLAHLSNIHPKALANILEVEHPQTISIVLIKLEPSHAAKVLNLLPNEVQEEVVSRIARLERVSPSVIEDIEKSLMLEVANLERTKDEEIKGKIEAAALLNQLAREDGIDILTRVEKHDDDLAAEIRQSMFTFQDLAGLDDRGMQTVLKEINSEDLLLALKTASDDLQAKFFRNMSSRAAEMMRDDLLAMGPVRLAEVETAQKNIAAVALRLQEEGTIVIAGAGDDVV